MRKILTCALAILALLATVQPPVQAATTPCAHATERCDATLETPLDPANAAGEKISISYAWVPARDRTRPPVGTVLVLPGGPAPSLWAVDSTKAWLGPALEHQNLLMLDQRGWGGSSPLACPGLDVAEPATVRQCADRARFFNTAHATRDIEALRAALGVPKLTVYGYSWGTLLAQAYAARHPNRIRAVLLDSVLSIDSRGYADMSFAPTARRGVTNLAAVCLPSAQCRRLPGQPAEHWTALIKQLRSRPDPQVSVHDLARLTGNLADPAIGREANAAADAFLRGDVAPLRRLVARFPNPGAMPSTPAQLAYVCADSALPYDRAAGLERRREQLARYRSQQPPRPYTAAEAFGAAGEAADWCLTWPTPNPTPPVPAKPAYPWVPALAIGGQFDTSTPPDNAILAARRFGGTAVAVPFGAHIGASVGQSGYHLCLQTTVRSFVTHLGVPAGAGRCSAENYRATGRFPRTTSELPQARVHGLDHGERQLLAAAFATVDDALAARNPNAAMPPGDATAPGLRGGRIDYRTGVTRLVADRFVPDVSVTGEIRTDNAMRATAIVEITHAGSTAKAIINWTPFQATGRPTANGTLDGTAFHGTIPRL
ncbi:alpha/beta fold hydrolase [Streptosporangium roseum]|uniref:alpha/beta fold hydrolase n=1 Tax=Streptosporangium roseum TaxID=2001 RepID=UPI0004CCEC44|nr:alpha/beta fold hydrolase [Streptosporangium roseum]